MTGATATTVSVGNNLVWAILATLFCCLPTGIVAIVYAAQVNTKLSHGDISGAQESARNAATWNWVSFGLGLLFLVGYFVLVFMSIAAGH
ncbi:MAG: CD225/dispanin family protein [Lysobacteraceae bacterium]